MLRRILTLLFAIVLLANFAFASVPVVHITPKPTWLNTYQPYNKDIPLHDVENGFSYALSEEQINVEQRADYIHVIRQIVSQAGIQNGSAINVSFDPSYQRIDFHDITVWRDGKPQNRLTPNLFKVIADEEELDKFIYQGSYSAYCNLPDIRKGDRIEFSYTITGNNPIFNDRFVRDFYLQGSRPIAHTFYSVITTPQHQLNFKSFNTKSKFAETVKNGVKYYTVEDFQVKAAHDYENHPEWYTSYAHIQISDYADWWQVVNWAMTVNPVPATATGKVAAEVAALKAETKDDKVKYFRAAVKFVQDEVRYMGIEIGEYSHRANTPENVLNHRYGDCKDKSLLLATMLNANGIPANLVLINTRMRQKTGEYLPSATVFNHCVVTANVNGTQMWIDPTISYQRGTAFSLYFPGYRQGLVLKAGNNALTDIPLSPGGRIVYNEVYTINSTNDTVDLKVVTKYTLAEADDMRQQLASNGSGGTEKGYLDYYQKEYPKADNADSLKVEDDEQNNQLTTIEHYTIPDYFKKDSTSDKRQATLFSEYITAKLSNAGTKTRYPIALTFPADIDYTARIILPAGWLLDDKDENIVRDAYQFHFTRKIEGDTVVLNYQLKNQASFVPLNQVDQYRKDVAQIEEYLPFNFTYSPDVGGDKFIPNYFMMVGVAVFALLLAFIAYSIYTKPTPKLILRNTYWVPSFGGWLPLLGFVMVVFSLLEIAAVFSRNDFNLINFQAHDKTSTEIGFKSIFLFETFGVEFLACFGIFCTVLFFNKRDIYKRYAIILFCCAVVYHIIDYAGLKALFPNMEFEKTMESVIRSIVAAAIWINFLRRSTGVKETFVRPYPHSNFEIDWPKPPQAEGENTPTGPLQLESETDEIKLEEGEHKVTDPLPESDKPEHHDHIEPNAGESHE